MISQIINTIALMIALSGMVIVLWGVIVTVFAAFKIERRYLKGKQVLKMRNSLRHSLGTYLLLGLEFLIAADIVRTVIHPTLKELAVLGIIVLIRTVIGLTLDKELAEVNLSGE